MTAWPVGIAPGANAKLFDNTNCSSYDPSTSVLAVGYFALSIVRRANRESRIQLFLCHLWGYPQAVPRASQCASAKHVCAWPAERVPVTHRDPEPVLHASIEDHLVLVVNAIGEFVVCAGAFILDVGNF